MTCVVTIHDGKNAPTLSEKMNPEDEAILWIAWDDKLDEDETITSSNWLTPAGFTVEGESFNDPIECVEECTTFVKTTSVKLQTSNTDGKYLIENQIATTKRDSLRRSFYIIVGTV